MAPEKARLQNFYKHDDDTKVITIFVHGYGNADSDSQTHIMHLVRMTNIDYNAYLFRWPSGTVVTSVIKGAQKGAVVGARLGSKVAGAKGAVIGAVVGGATGGVVGIGGSYFINRAKCEDYSEQLYQRVRRIPNIMEYTIDLVGHSLGAFMVFNSLQSSRRGWSTLPIRNVVLMGAAFSSGQSSTPWYDALELLSGKMFNVWSDSDMVLTFEPNLKTRIGKSKVLIRNDKFRNIKMRNYGHSDYWKRYQTVYNATILKSLTVN